MHAFFVFYKTVTIKSAGTLKIFVDRVVYDIEEA